MLAGIGMFVQNLGRLPAEYRKLIEEYTSAMKAHFGERVVSLCVFGSVARGQATPESDIDVLSVVDGMPEDMGLRIRETTSIHLSLREGGGL